MVAPGAHNVEFAFLATAAAVGGAALLLASVKALFWARYFLRSNPDERNRASREPLDPSFRLPPSSADWLALIELETRRDPDRGNRLAETLLSASRRKTLAVELLSSTAAIVGLAGSLISLAGLRDPGPGPGPGLGESLSWILAPLVVGTALFVAAQGALGLCRSWGDALRDGVFQAHARARRQLARDDGAGRLSLPGTVVAMAVQLPPAVPGLPPAPPAAPPGLKFKLGRRALERPPSRSFRDSLRSGGFLLACFIASLLLHSAVFFAARRLDSATNPGKAGDREGVFLANIVEPPKPVPAPPEETHREEPRVVRETLPRPEPVPPPVDPVREAVPPDAETKPLTEQPKAAPRAEEVASPPPPPTTPLREAAPEASEPPSRLADAKNREAQKPTSASSAPRVTETPPEVPAIPQVPAGPPPSPPAPAEVRSAAPAERAPSSDALGQGPGSRTPEPREARSPSDSAVGTGIISTTQEYRQFLAREMRSGATEGQYVPNLRFGDNKAQENREIMRYFGMELIAYPKNQKFYVYIDPEQGLYSRSNDFSYIRNFSSRAIFRNSPYFDALRAEAARRVSVEPQSLVVAQLLKPSSAAYIGWKEAECARKAGVVLEEVEACEATFVKSPFGLWIVRIDRLLMKDGRALPVRDFEWTRVSGAAGGDK
jgi:hypothetical protein